MMLPLERLPCLTTISMGSVARVLALIVSLITTVEAIDCYKCTSIDGQHDQCEDKFDTGIATVNLIARKCQYGYFRGTHCIKLKGEREDGTRMLVRDCSDDDWGSHCGDIRYVFGDQEQMIYGCLEACDQDGCNSGTTHAPSIVLMMVVPILLACALRYGLHPTVVVK